MARKRERMFALFGAILFLITSSALTIGVIFTLYQQSHPSNSVAPSKPKTSTVKAQPPISQTKSLAGTKMQNFIPITTPITKLQVVDLKVGTGPVIKVGDTFYATYVGALAKTGVIFDASVDHGGPMKFTLTPGQLIPGWIQGIPGMRVGGTRRLIIPASLGYGSASQPGIPANSPLVFDVTITKL